MTYCKGDDCKGKKKKAIYNFAGLKSKFCGTCKLPNMVDIKHPKCITCNDKIPHYNLPTESRALYCGTCKKSNMVDVVNFKCIICNNKRPTFNLPTERKALYCVDCKLSNMTDVIHSKCITNLCEKKSKKNKYCMRCYNFHNPSK